MREEKNGRMNVNNFVIYKSLVPSYLSDRILADYKDHAHSAARLLIAGLFHPSGGTILGSNSAGPQVPGSYS